MLKVLDRTLAKPIEVLLLSECELKILQRGSDLRGI